MKEKTHKFIVEVKTTSSAFSARNKLLCSFALRQPDGCKFTIKHYRGATARIKRLEAIVQELGKS